MKQRIYVDTSVFGGMFDIEFQAETSLFFDMVNSGEIICLYSDITENELVNAPERVKYFFENLTCEQKQKVPITPEAFALAKNYVDENVVGQTSFDDCVHIATATVNRADMLVSWNFKHIVNVYRIKNYNSINLKLGYQIINIHSPKELVGYEKQ
ncbi:MAG: hypothetical protein LBN95_09430 [Prevotellaceae bacterium]|jgi:hypothetical protein|nr:hypothetical protein [Prevotellaceae bacterium]